MVGLAHHRGDGFFTGQRVAIWRQDGREVNEGKSLNVSIHLWTLIVSKITMIRNFPGSQWLRLCTSSAEGMGSIPGGGDVKQPKKQNHNKQNKNKALVCVPPTQHYDVLHTAALTNCPLGHTCRKFQQAHSLQTEGAGQSDPRSHGMFWPVHGTSRKPTSSSLTRKQIGTFFFLYWVEGSLW